MEGQDIFSTNWGTAGDKKRCSHVPEIRYDVGHSPIRFYLKQNSFVDKQSQIIMSISVQGRRYRIYTKMKVEPAFWDRFEQRCADSELLCARVRKRVQRVNKH